MDSFDHVAAKIVAVLLGGAVAISFVACCKGFPPEDASNVENAAKTSAAAYHHVDAYTPTGALIRATHCSVQAVIRNEKLPPYDGGITCP